MTAESSPEIEAVLRRVIAAWQQGDVETISNLFSDSSHLRVLGFDVDEWWAGPEEFRGVFAAQATEMPDWEIEIDQSEAFEESNFGWGTLFTTLRTTETTTPMRHTAFLRLDSGSWRIVHWQNSIPVSNQQIYGVELTKGLDHLMDSVLRDDAIPEGLEGTTTLEFTDIVDSTRLAESVGDVEWARLIHDHEATIRRITESHDGNVVKFLGDGAMLAFKSAREAIRAALEIQRSCLQAPFSVRIGVHTGEVLDTGKDILGLTVNKAARVASAAGPDEIMISSTTRDLIGSMSDITTGEPRIVALKGLSDTHQIVPVKWS